MVDSLPLAVAVAVLADRSGVSSPTSGTTHAEWEWALGITLCLLGAATTNLGLTLQKRSFLSNDAQPLSEQRSASKQPLWLAGLGVFIIGQLLNLLAFGYTSQAVAATLGSFSLVTNGIFAPLLLRERLTRPIVLSIAIIVAGSIAVVMSSSRAPQDFALDELIDLLQRPLFVAYISALMVAFLVALATMWREDVRFAAAHALVTEEEERAAGKALEYVGESTGVAAPPNPAAVQSANPNWSVQAPPPLLQSSSLELDPELAGCGATYEMANALTMAAGANTNTWREHQPMDETSALLGVKIKPGPGAESAANGSTGGGDDSPTSPSRPLPLSSVPPIIAAAILSSCSVLFGKCSVQLLKTSFAGENQFADPLSWILTGVFLTCAISAVVFLNVGLRRGTALFVVPLYFVLNTLLAITGGLIYFEEFKRFSFEQGALFAGGVVLTVVGVWVSSRDQVQEEDGGIAEELALLSSSSEGETSETPSSAASSSPSPDDDAAVPLPPLSTATDDVEAQRASAAAALTRKPRPMEIGGQPAAAAAAINAAAATAAAKSVRFDPESPLRQHSDSAVDSLAPRLVRAASAPGLGLSPAELEAAMQEEGEGEGEAGTGTGASLHTGSALSTPQPGARSAYGSMESSLASSAHAFRTPGQRQHRRHHHAHAEGEEHKHEHRMSRRARSMSHLTAEQQAAARLRDQQLAAAGWRRQQNKRYSLDRSAYKSSFDVMPAAGAGEILPRKPVERRYSVAVIGLGIS